MVAALVIALFASGVWGWHTLTQRRSQPRLTRRCESV